jgi:hypothetical protein
MACDRSSVLSFNLGKGKGVDHVWNIRPSGLSTRAPCAMADSFASNPVPHPNFSLNRVEANLSAIDAT